MTCKLSLDDYYNIVEYNNFERQINIYQTKKLALYLFHKKMCVCYCNDKKVSGIRNMILRHRVKSKNNKNINNATKKNYGIHLRSANSTRATSPLSMYL